MHTFRAHSINDWKTRQGLFADYLISMLRFEILILIQNLRYQCDVSVVALKSFSDCLKVLSLTKQLLGEILSAFEVIDLEARRVVIDNLEQAYPLEEESPFHLLIETSGA